ncbi:hypothetical protein V8D89_010028, partial [Ganoderma adspersum]
YVVAGRPLRIDVVVALCVPSSAPLVVLLRTVSLSQFHSSGIIHPRASSLTQILAQRRRIPVTMPTFNFAPRISTSVTVMSTLPSAFAALAKPTATASPLGSVLDSSSLFVRDDDDCDSDDDEDDSGSSKTPPGHGGNPPGQAKKACRTSSAAASTSSTTLPPPSSTQSPTPTAVPSIQPTSTALGVTASGSTQASGSTSTDGSATSTDSTPSPGSQASTTGSGTTTSTSTSTSSQSTSLTASSGSGSGVPAANLSTPSPPTTSSNSSAPTPPAIGSGLTVGSAVGIALGVFAVSALLVAAAVVLFLFLRKRRRKRRRRRHDSASERKLRSFEGPPSRPLSSTWSWFGSLAIGSEPGHDVDAEHTFGTRTSPHPHDVDWDDPFYGLGGRSEKCATVRDSALPPQALRTVELIEDVPGPRQAGARAEHASEGLRDVPEYDSGVDTEEQGARDPFVDPGLSAISDMSMVESSVEVESVKAW